MGTVGSGGAGAAGACFAALEFVWLFAGFDGASEEAPDAACSGRFSCSSLNEKSVIGLLRFARWKKQS
jgi:hypothetical protein